MNLFKRYLNQDDAATAIEYGLIIAFLSVAIITVVFAIGGDIEGFFNTVLSAISSSHV